jgi:hypothetical protein
MGNGREKNMYHALALFTAFCGIGIGLEFGIWKLEIGFLGDFYFQNSSKAVPKQFRNRFRILSGTVPNHFQNHF